MSTISYLAKTEAKLTESFSTLAFYRNVEALGSYVRSILRPLQNQRASSHSALTRRWSYTICSDCARAHNFFLNKDAHVFFTDKSKSILNSDLHSSLHFILYICTLSQPFKHFCSLEYLLYLFNITKRSCYGQNSEALCMLWWENNW